MASAPPVLNFSFLHCLAEFAFTSLAAEEVCWRRLQKICLLHRLCWANSEEDHPKGYTFSSRVTTRMEVKKFWHLAYSQAAWPSGQRARLTIQRSRVLVPLWPLSGHYDPYFPTEMFRLLNILTIMIKAILVLLNSPFGHRGHPAPSLDPPLHQFM